MRPYGEMPEMSGVEPDDPGNRPAVVLHGFGQNLSTAL